MSFIRAVNVLFSIENVIYYKQNCHIKTLLNPKKINVFCLIAIHLYIIYTYYTYLSNKIEKTQGQPLTLKKIVHEYYEIHVLSFYFIIELST